MREFYKTNTVANRPLFEQQLFYLIDNREKILHLPDVTRPIIKRRRRNKPLITYIVDGLTFSGHDVCTTLYNTIRNWSYAQYEHLIAGIPLP